MNPLVDEFIHKVLSKVKYKKVHPMLAKELYDHIECIKEEHCSEGVEEVIAYEQAIHQMGEPEEIGEDLYRMHKPRNDWFVALFIGVIVAFSIYILKASGKEESIVPMLLYSALGMGGFFICYFFNYQKLEKYSFMFLGIGISVLIFTKLWGNEINGARRWFSLGPASIQTVAIVIPIFLVGFAGLLIRFDKENLRGKAGLALISIICIVLTWENYMVEGVILMVTLYVTTISYVNRHLKHTQEDKRNKIVLLLIGTVSVLASVLFVLLEGYRLERLHIWRNPELYPQGYQILNIRKIIDSAGWFGDSGLQSIASIGGWELFSHGTEDHTFLYIVGHLGVFAAVLTICVLITLIVRSFILSRQQRDTYGNVLMTAISIFFALQAAMGILTHLNLLPGSSVYVPFLSYNGSSIVFELTSLGLFLGVHRRKDILPNELVACEK